MADDQYERTQEWIHVDDSTLAWLVKRGVTCTESNSKKAWLTKEDRIIIINFTIEMAHCEFPLSPRRLHEHAEHILVAWLSKRFPETGLGKNWATHFITKHHDRLRMYWSSPLDSSRG